VKTSLSKQCASAAALTFLGLGFHLFYAGEVFTMLIISGVMILFAILTLLSAFLIWQAYKRIAAILPSPAVMPSLPTATEIAKTIE
jgi:hypothetical protein